MLKKLLLLATLLTGWLNLNAQNEANIKLKIEAGLLMAFDKESTGVADVDNLGLFFRIEPTLKTSKNTFIGLRIGVAVNTQKIENHDPLQFDLYRNISTGLIQFMDVDNRIISVVPTFDYSFVEKKYRPYLGLGVGYFFLTNYTDIFRRDVSNPSEGLLKISTKNQVGFLLRGGLDLGKLKVGLEFNYIPDADIKIPNSQVIGTVDNSYIGLSVGYAIGVGR